MWGCLDGVMDIDPELLEEFRAEANEHLATVEDDVLALEQGGAEVDADTVNHLFRALHTVKGGGNVMGFAAIAELGHALEDVVGLIREGGLVPAKPVSDVLLAGIDKLKALVDAPGEEAVVVADEVAALRAILEAPPPADEPADAPPPVDLDVDPELLEEFAAEVDEHLATVEDDVLALEAGGADVDEETVNHLFRALHTVKGGGNLMGFALVTELAHALENAVGLIREGELVPSKAVSDVLLAGIDKLKLLVKDPNDASVSFEDEVAALGRLANGDGGEEVDADPGLSPSAPETSAAPAPELDVDPELLEEFAAEVNEHLATVEEDVLALERGGGVVDEETVNHLFRALHTVKGGGNLMGFTLVAELAHALENVVGLIREGELTPAKSVSDALLRGIDKLKLLVSDPVNASAPIQEEMAALEQVVGGDESSPLPVVTEPAPPPASPLPPVAAASIPDAVPVVSDPGDESAEVPARAAAAGGRVMRQPKAEGDQALRISLVLLDRLMNLATELVLVRNQNRQAVESRDQEQLATISQRLNVVTSELQASIMQTRMRPVGATFTKFRRAVRDLARKLGKEVELEIIGSDVELDKTIIEAIGDPLTHLVRNSVDHGIELPEERRRKGKSPVGHVRLWAYHQAGQVNIEISDDGKGMDPEKLKTAAVKKGILRPEQTRLLSNREAINLIFEPGFSTAAGVSDVSGRGVGMDVVKASFQRLGGVVDLSSEVDKGTTTTIKLPLTLAIVPALIVAVGDHRFAVPEVNIHEVVWLCGEDAVTGIERVDSQEVFWLREQLLPVLRLSDVLEADSPGARSEPRLPAGARRVVVPGDRDSPELAGAEAGLPGGAAAQAGADANVYIIVLEAGSEQFGLLVDTIIDTEEIVVKPLHEQLKDCAMYAGTTVLGDGNIAMILDVAAVADIGKIRYANVEKAMLPSHDSQAEHRAALFFSIGGTERFALPLFFITRVEEIQSDEIQMANEREYWDFRGSLIPLLRVEQTIPRIRARYPDGKLYIIIPKCRRPFGIIAGHILDAIDVPNQIDSSTINQPGIIGSQLIDGRLTLFLDPFALIEQVEPSWFATEETEEVRRVLLVDDSPFSRLLVASYLHGTGISITTAEDGEGGLQVLAEGTFDCVISDIEMPVMDGYGFARAVREQPRYMNLPLLAISGASGHIVDQALDAGFSDFASKFDRTALVAAVKRLCFRTASVV